MIALISGGKDSLYSILHCMRSGHKLVALANLHPEPAVQGVRDGRNTPTGPDQSENTASAATEEEEDIDSFMYQTIGHSVIPLYESALGIPLYRASITGGAVDTARIYGHDAVDQSTEQSQSQSTSQLAPEPDETESLVPLFRRIQEAHPEANAVSAGAILSTYQRTRIENVAARLGLIPLAWLWMYPTLPAPEARENDALAVGEAGLLEDMAGVGCDARIIKAASGGLDEGFLWENVSGSGNEGRMVRRRIVKAMARFADGQDVRGAVLGEGGEYETLAVDGPGFLWKKRIQVQAREVKSGEGGVAFLRLMGAECVDKTGTGEEVKLEDVRRPALLDGCFASVLAEGLDISLKHSSVCLDGRKTPSAAWLNCEPHHSKSNSTWTISNLTAPEAGPDAADQMNGIIAKVRAALDTTTYLTGDIVFATVLLNSMADFASMNNIYVSLFKKPNPPARVTVACGDALPSNVKIMVSFVVDLGSRSYRQGLHVQSRSYWAPANIGPYSQAMSIPLQGESRVIYIAGQIPLEPASMELASSGKGSWFEDYSLRAVLSLQHLWRIGHAMQVDWWLGGVAFLTGSPERIQAQVDIAWHLWKRMHTRVDEGEDDEGSQLDAWDIKYGRRVEETTAESASLPRFDVLDDGTETIPPFFAVEVDELPRGSDIEWQGLGSRCERIVLESKEDSVSTTLAGRYRYIGLEIDLSQPLSLEDTLRDVMDRCQGQSSVKAVLYTTESVTEGFWAGQVVPCRSAWGREGRRLTAGVVLQMEAGSDDL